MPTTKLEPGQNTLAPADQFTKSSLVLFADDPSGRVVVKLEDQSTLLSDDWTETIDWVSGLPVEVRRADCGLGCRCAGEVRVIRPASPPEFSPENPLPVSELRTDGDRTRKYIMRCKHHPNLQYRSKDPHASSIFASQPGTCDCTYLDLEVIGREK